MKKGSSSDRQCYKRPGSSTPKGSSGDTCAGVALGMALTATGWMGFDQVSGQEKQEEWLCYGKGVDCRHK